LHLTTEQVCHHGSPAAIGLERAADSARKSQPHQRVAKTARRGCPVCVPAGEILRIIRKKSGLAASLVRSAARARTAARALAMTRGNPARPIITAMQIVP